jgi:hypothetical protein
MMANPHFFSWPLPSSQSFITPYNIMAQAQVAEAFVPLENSIDTKILKEKLRFRFQGYAIWLEIEQFPASDSDGEGRQAPQKNDLECAIQTASKELGVYPIPSPHLTALYGINHLAEAEVRNRFQDLSRQLRNGEMDWPLLEPSGFLSDVEFEGIDGGEMVSISTVEGFKFFACDCLRPTKFEQFSTTTSGVEHGVDGGHLHYLTRA